MLQVMIVCKTALFYQSGKRQAARKPAHPVRWMKSRHPLEHQRGAVVVAGEFQVHTRTDQNGA
ncbi:hypothetical protein BH10ACI4_BH10ACI4_09200 [soil metagenome]